MKLYEIDEILENSFVFDEETGEMLNPNSGEIFTSEEFENLAEERSKKLEGLLFKMRNLEAEAKAYSEEKQRFFEKEKTAKKQIESIKKFLKNYLNGEKFSGKYFKVSYRSSVSVQINNMNKIPVDYLKYKEPEPDKARIKEAIRCGIPVEGASLVENQNIIIK